ncbi:hypothetical protein Hanom_Chr01g00022921 [Helianthus anomalus]
MYNLMDWMRMLLDMNDITKIKLVMDVDVGRYSYEYEYMTNIG